MRNAEAATIGMKAKYSKRQWLHFSENGLCLFETGPGSDALPYLDIVATLSAAAVLSSPTQHIRWVKEHCRGGRLNILLDNSLYQLLLSDVPDVPEEELREAIELKAADLISYDIDDALVDVILLPSEAYRGRMKMAFIVALMKTPMQRWMTELAQVGIKVNVIDVEVTQLRNLAVFHQTVPETGILHLKPSSSRLLLTYQNEMVLSRSFEIGLGTLLKEQTVSDGELELTLSQSDSSDIQLESLALEIRRSFDYYESQLGLGALGEIRLLCDAQFEYLADELSRRLGVRFSLMRPEDFMTIRLSQTDLDPVHYYGLTGTVYREALS